MISLEGVSTVFIYGDARAYKVVRGILKKGIGEVNYEYNRSIEDDFKNNNSHCMWTGIKAFTDYKSNTLHSSMDASLPIC